MNVLYDYEHCGYGLNVIVLERFNLAISGSFNSGVILHDLESGATIKKIIIENKTLSNLFDLGGVILVELYGDLFFIDLVKKQEIEYIKIKENNISVQCLQMISKKSKKNRPEKYLLLTESYPCKLQKLKLSKKIIEKM